MRLEAPPERMTAAIMCYLTALATLENWRWASFVLQFLVLRVRHVPPNGNQLRRDAYGNFFRRESPDLQSHGRIDAFEFFGFIALVLQRLVYRQYFSFASDHAHVAHFGAHRPAQHTHVFLVPARHDHQVARGIRMKLFECLLVARVNL